MAADPSLQPSSCSAAVLRLGCMVQPPPALAVIDTHVTGQLLAKTRTLFFSSLVYHQLPINSFNYPTTASSNPIYVGTCGSTGLGEGLCSQRWRTRLVQTC